MAFPIMVTEVASVLTAVDFNGHEHFSADIFYWVSAVTSGYWLQREREREREWLIQLVIC